MKIIISTKYLALNLNKINFFEGDYVSEVTGLVDGIRLKVGPDDFYIDLECDVNKAETLEQSDVRWDCIRKTVLAISEQPAVLEISEKAVNVILSY